MSRRGIHLSYTFEPRGQAGAEIENPLFDLLSALQLYGSISAVAQARGQSYRHVWGALKHWEALLATPLVLWAQGRHARLTPFAERLLWAERQARARLAPHVEALRAELGRAFALADDPALQVLEVFASHDLALPQLPPLAAAGPAPLHLGLHFTGSEDALRALGDGRCSVAGFHVPRPAALAAAGSVFAQALRPRLRPGRHKLIGSHWRRQGLMWRAGEPGPDSLAALARPRADGRRWRFVQRQAGSGTRLLTEALLAQAGIDGRQLEGSAGRVEHTHLAVAAAVAAGRGDAGVGVEAAARAYGLDFLPLVDEDYYLVCLQPALETPPLQQLRALLAAPAWAAAVSALPGYGVQRAGEVLSLTRALPWWHWSRPARPRGSGG